MGQAEGAALAWKEARSWRDSRWSCPSVPAHGEGYIPRSRRRIHKNHPLFEVGVAEKLLISRIFQIRRPKKDYGWTNWNYLGGLNYPPVQRAPSLVAVVEGAEQAIPGDSLLECLARYAMMDYRPEDDVWQHPWNYIFSII